ncbi:hypothetical protein FCN77_12865 [Arthrobacter sp. 24S4-2]|uniref:hypothetical protein n=1 Tax=Arthrobacter sp. 24S4-2 TaxID=2575374 RepID=UPI0010C7C5C8|nr:hypothetical protein [Arthrobacter sp. 24S4-2]QCO98417.1 hypothetical protein FCN77_12865 [Arthrobacter sp. 24S4-2]
MDAHIVEIPFPRSSVMSRSAMTVLKAHYPDKVVLAHATNNVCEAEQAQAMFTAGADLVCLPGAAADSCIAEAIKAAKKHRKGIVADLSQLAEKTARAKEVLAMGFVGVKFVPDFVCIPPAQQPL